LGLTIKKEITEYDFPEELKEMEQAELPLLAAQIRDFLISNVAMTGGHLSSNLGAVELTMALHRVFDLPHDKIIWDVGHQIYTHKILTGRAHAMGSLRQTDGLSGFPRPSESATDVIASGHSSTSISTAMGIAEARDINGDDYNVIAVIGDGAMTGGPAYEGLNNAGTKRTRIIVILNDNNMSIGRNVGSISQHLSHLRASKSYLDMKKLLKRGITQVPGIGESLFRGLEHVRDLARYALITESIFEDLGFSYYGPVDGHDTSELADILNAAKSIDGPILIHAVTRKGKGYKNAEDNPDHFHGIGSFDSETGVVVKSPSGLPWSDLAGRELLRLADTDERIIAITAAMTDGTGLKRFKEQYSKRFFDVGIAEGHAVSFAAGLAIAGLRPFVCIYSSFLQRAYDQIICDIALQKLPVVFLIDRAGNVGADGELHHGLFDLSYLGHIPNVRLFAPADDSEFISIMDFAQKYNDGPVFIRYPRGTTPGSLTDDMPVDPTKSRVLLSTDNEADTEIWAAGTMAAVAIEAAKILAPQGICDVVSAVSVRPLDSDALQEAAKTKKAIITLEDNILRGGFGEYVSSYLSGEGYSTPVLCIGWPDQFIEHGDISDLQERYGLSPNKIAERITDFLGSLQAPGSV